MCVVSAMGDHYKDQFDPFKKYISDPTPFGKSLQQNDADWSKLFKKEVTREEFNELKRQVEEMKKILKVAAEYDARNNEPHCEIEDKVKLLKEIAKLVGVDMSDVFPQTILQPFMQVVNLDQPTSVTTVTGGTPGEVSTYKVDYDQIKGETSFTSNSGSL